jgi:hypothetical protein
MLHFVSHSLYDARQFMAGDMRKANIGVMSHPAVPVTSAKTGRFHSDNDPMVFGTGIRHISDLQSPPEFFIHDGFHFFLFSQIQFLNTGSVSRPGQSQSLSSSSLRLLPSA